MASYFFFFGGGGGGGLSQIEHQEYDLCIELLVRHHGLVEKSVMSNVRLTVLPLVCSLILSL